MDLARGQRINHAASVKRKVFRPPNQARGSPRRFRTHQPEGGERCILWRRRWRENHLIGGIEDETTILEDSPIFACANADNRDAKERNGQAPRA